PHPPQRHALDPESVGRQRGRVDVDAGDLVDEDFHRAPLVLFSCRNFHLAVTTKPRTPKATQQANSPRRAIGSRSATGGPIHSAQAIQAIVENPAAKLKATTNIVVPATAART